MEAVLTWAVATPFTPLQLPRPRWQSSCQCHVLRLAVGLEGESHSSFLSRVWGSRFLCIWGRGPQGTSDTLGCWPRASCGARKCELS